MVCVCWARVYECWGGVWPGWRDRSAGGENSPEWPILGVLTQYLLHMQTICGGGGGSVLVEVDMHVDMVGSAVGEIDWQEGVSP
jgi:hypothetical protein